MISNRIVFKSSPNDFAALLNAYRSGIPQLGTGDCVYNREAGDPSANIFAHSFYFPKKEIDSFLESIADMNKEKGGEDVHTVVFRGNDLPAFAARKVSPDHLSTSSNPEEIGIYFGENIAISKVDVNVTLMRENGDNILILGGEQKVAQRIAYYSALSATTAYTEQSASFSILSFLRSSDELNSEMSSMFEALPFNTEIAGRTTEVTRILESLKAEIEKRRNEEDTSHPDIFLIVIGMQQGRAFDLGGRRGDEPSDCGKMLEFILRNGPQVGIMTILQADRLNSLNKICFSASSALQLFNYRVALQMDERDSNSVMDSPAASKLFQFNRPSSVYRAFLRDNGRNLSVKFKPYK